MFHVRGCAHSWVQGQPAPVRGPPQLSGEFSVGSAWAMGRPLGRMGAHKREREVYAER